MWIPINPTSFQLHLCLGNWQVAACLQSWGERNSENPPNSFKNSEQCQQHTLRVIPVLLCSRSESSSKTLKVILPSSKTVHFPNTLLFISAHVCAQSCRTLCDPVDCSPPGSSVRGISQARTLEWVAISSSRGSSQPRDWTCIFCTGRWVLYCSAYQGFPSLRLVSNKSWTCKSHCMCGCSATSVEYDSLQPHGL